MFPLRLKGGQHLKPVAVEKMNALTIVRERMVHKLDRAELRHKASEAAKKPGAREVVGKQYQRNEYVAEEARLRAAGICQLCELPAPFSNKSDQPYLEVHHVVWLAKGGDDSLENTVALCPNCHRKMHILDLPADKEKLLIKNRSAS